MFKGVTSGYDRLEKYKAKVRAFSGTGSGPDYTAPVIQHMLSGMYRKASLAFNEQATIGNQVSAYLGTSGISVVGRGSYQAFASQMYRLTRTQTGESLKIEVEVVIAAWVARGLTQIILEGIRSDIFGVGEPTPP